VTSVGPQLPLPSRLGSYELIRPIAQGGMADIYLARRAGPGQFERHVAIKLLSPARAGGAEACAMFLDEARLVALLNHQNIAAVLEVDVVDGKHYLAMEYVHGVDLRELLAAAQRAGTLPPLPVALAVACAAAAGLDHAHRRCGPDGRPLELVHRDVSLSNIMVGHDGSVKVVDFGIASTNIASVHTLPGLVRGKSGYMSPEQCQGDPVDARSDVFALGVVLYELTTGARCFRGRTDFDRMIATVRGDHVAPGELVPGYPPELAEVIHTALASDRDARFASAAEFARALEGVALSRGWALGAGAIQRTMRDLFGEVPEPWTVCAEDAPATEPHAMVSLGAISELTRPARRLARGTRCDELATDDELDERTLGRGPLRRPARPWLAA
ncbi:MAG TPA: serine/threonine-protein kinase, partial [Kofleriaceae bacterium]|nr:serine/threonine-protein kinase [Kofleriaceae bacterium]